MLSYTKSRPHAIRASNAGKTFFQTLFFFLLVTQICFTQWHQQANRTILNTKNGLIDQQDKRFPIIGANIHSGKTHASSIPNFKNNLQTEIDPFDVNNTSYLFQNDRLIPNGLQKNSPPIHRMLSPKSQIYVIDTAIVRRLSGGDITDLGDTTRHLYSFNTSAKRTSDVTQKLVGEFWVNVERQTKTYDAANYMLSDVYECWENGQWVNSWRDTYTYDANGNKLSNLQEQWSTGQWVNYYRYTFTYDASGNKLSDLQEQWSTGQWVNDYRYTFTYDANGNNLTWSFEYWSNGQWANSVRVTYTYDSNGNNLSALSERWSTGHWEIYSRYTFTYDSNGNNLTWLVEYWSNGQWINSARATYTYNSNGNKPSELYEQWVNGQWENSVRVTYTYDSNGNKLSDLQEHWSNGQWANSFRFTFTYDAQGNLTSVWHHDWMDSSWAPANYRRGGIKGGLVRFDVTDRAGNTYGFLGYNFTFIYRLLVTGVVSDDANVSATYYLSQNYPNPFNPNTRISWQLPVGGEVTLKVYDVLGNEIATLVNEEKEAGYHSVDFNGSDLPSGVYFYKLIAGNFISTRKMLLLK